MSDMQNVSFDDPKFYDNGYLIIALSDNNDNVLISGLRYVCLPMGRCGVVGCCGVVDSTLAFGSIGHGFESENPAYFYIIVHQPSAS